MTSLAPHPTVFSFSLILSVSIILRTEFTWEPKFTQNTVLFTSPATLLIVSGLGSFSKIRFIRLSEKIGRISGEDIHRLHQKYPTFNHFRN